MNSAQLTLDLQEDGGRAVHGMLDSLVVPGRCPHATFGEVWVTKLTATHISFEAFIKPRTIGRFKQPRDNFLRHNTEGQHHE